MRKIDSSIMDDTDMAGMYGSHATLHHLNSNFRPTGIRTPARDCLFASMLSLF